MEFLEKAPNCPNHQLQRWFRPRCLGARTSVPRWLSPGSGVDSTILLQLQVSHRFHIISDPCCLESDAQTWHEDTTMGWSVGKSAEKHDQETSIYQKVVWSNKVRPLVVVLVDCVLWITCNTSAHSQFGTLMYHVWDYCLWRRKNQLKSSFAGMSWILAPPTVRGLQVLGFKLMFDGCFSDRGELFVWGKNVRGCLGIGKRDDQYFPWRVRWFNIGHQNSWKCRWGNRKMWA